MKFETVEEYLARGGEIEVIEGFGEYNPQPTTFMRKFHQKKKITAWYEKNLKIGDKVKYKKRSYIFKGLTLDALAKLQPVRGDKKVKLINLFNDRDNSSLKDK